MTPTLPVRPSIRKLGLCLLALTALTTAPVLTQNPSPSPDTELNFERTDHPLPRGISLPTTPGSGDRTGSLFARHLTAEHFPRFAHKRRGDEADVSAPPRENPYVDPAPVGQREPVMQLENYNWVIKLGVGTPAQALEAVIQTHIDATIFPGAKTGLTYKPDQSETGKPIASTAPQDTEYYSWTADIVSIGDKTLTDVAIGVALNESDAMEDTGMNKGILGLQLLAPDRDLTPDGSDNFFSAAAKQLGLGSDGGGAMVGLALGLDCQGGAEVSVGGVNPDLFDGKTLKWFDVTNVGANVLWSAHISYEGVKSELPCLFISAGVANFIWADDAKKVFDQMGLNYTVDADSGDVTAKVPCDNPPPYEMKVGEYVTQTTPLASVLQMEDGTCISSLIGDGESQNAWFAGLPFFMGVYVILDAAEQRMGFADRIVDNSKCEGPSPSKAQTPNGQGGVSQQQQQEQQDSQKGHDSNGSEEKGMHEGISSGQGPSQKAASLSMYSVSGGGAGRHGRRSYIRGE